MLEKKALLCVNIDHIATIREARKGVEPNIVEATLLCEQAGADGITVHLREDRRHIQTADLFALKEVIKSRFTLEMSASDEILEIAKKINPHLLTIVPEKRAELTTEGGLNLKEQKDKITNFLLKAFDFSLEASLFIEPDLETIEIAHEIGAKQIELHTGKYANCSINSLEALSELQRIKTASNFARKLGLKVNLGHGLNLQNLKPILQIKDLEELHIGHSIIARAVLIGLPAAVKEVKDLIQNS
jgi:pyridoxine 5-phosphate synthase